MAIRLAPYRFHQALLVFLFLLLLPLLTIEAQRPASKKAPPRAAPPIFGDEEKSVFPNDAFSELIGARPAWVDPSQLAGPTMASESSSTNRTKTNPTEGAWSDWIDEETLESEIKRQAKALATATSSAARFKSGEFRRANDALGIISVMMAINTEHDGVPRWQSLAAKLRDLFASADESAQGELEANDMSFEVAGARSEELAELIRGGRPNIEVDSSETAWSHYASRGALMRRMEQADEDRLSVWIADRRTWRRNSEAGRHEAQILAALAEAIIQPEAYDADDEDYQAFARQLRDAATALALAAEEEDQPAAEEAHRKAMQSCRDCHADYRG